jgi:hypothetical protein
MEDGGWRMETEVTHPLTHPPGQAVSSRVTCQIRQSCSRGRGVGMGVTGSQLAGHAICDSGQSDAFPSPGHPSTHPPIHPSTHTHAPLTTS